MSDRLLLVRHGLTDWNREGRFQGHLDPPLSDDGREQARLIATRLAASAGERPRRIVSSPLLRALETAALIAEAIGLPTDEVGRDARLMELGQGAWEGRTHAELAVSDAERYAAWLEGSWDRQPPDGEPVNAAMGRVRASIEEAIRGTAGNWPLCVVSHGGSLRLAAGWLLDLSPAKAWALEIDNASLSILERDTHGWRLVTWNDAGHLLGHVAQHVDEGEPQAL
ncbi:MAG: histidine phosphatase family protein [Chloroflexota bacterium]|nr:histidine phosphatase family protein [Chloroflexota bacterium]